METENEKQTNSADEIGRICLDLEERKNDAVPFYEDILKDAYKSFPLLLPTAFFKGISYESAICAVYMLALYSSFQIHDTSLMIEGIGVSYPVEMEGPAIVLIVKQNSISETSYYHTFLLQKREQELVLENTIAIGSSKSVPGEDPFL